MCDSTQLFTMASNNMVVQSMTAVAREALLRVGLPAESVQPLRIHSNAVFVEPQSGVVVRIGGGADAVGRAERAVMVTRWLTEIGFPTVRPCEGVMQPLVLSDASGLDVAVTFWHLVTVEDRASTGSELGGLMRWLHSLPSPPFTVASFRPLDRLVAAVNTGEWLPEPDRAWLLDRAAHLQAEFGQRGAVLREPRVGSR